MKVIIAITFLIALAAAQSGIAIIRGTTADSGITGWATFVTNATTNLVDVTINITGITQNPDALHGIHVHMWGDISDPTGNAAGGHFSIAGQVHACPPNDTRHLGDMGNWQATGGAISDTKSFDLLTLTGVNSIIGRGLIVHAGVDDCVTQPTGNSGARLAQAVIGIMNVTGPNNASNGSPRTSNGLDIAICNLVPVGTPAETIGGYGYITQGPTGGVFVVVQLTGVNGTNVHAVHIHQYGDLRTGASVGGHWNPTVERHGMYGYPHHHAGDLGNVYLFPTANQPAANFTQLVNNSFNVVGGLYNVIGLAMVVHQNRDDCTDPVGNAGARYATCVWGIASALSTNLTKFNPAMPTGLTTAYDATTIAACDASFNISTTTTTTTGTTTTGTTTTTTTTAAGTTGSASLVIFSLFTVLAAVLF